MCIEHSTPHTLFAIVDHAFFRKACLSVLAKIAKLPYFDQVHHKWLFNFHEDLLLIHVLI